MRRDVGRRDVETNHVIQHMQNLLRHHLALTAFVTALVVGPDGCTYATGSTQEAEGPVPVDIGIFIIDVSEVDDAAQTFRADFHLSARWRDADLVEPGSNGIRRFALSDIWNPQIGVRNRRDATPSFPLEAEVDADGNVHYRQRMSGLLTARLDLRDFPYDSQVLPIEVVSLRYGPDDVSFRLDDERTGSLESFTLPGWDVSLGEARTSSISLAGVGREVVQIDLPIHVHRKTEYYRWTMLAPLVLLVLMAWSAFWIDPSLLPSQIAVSTASVFALIAFRLSTRDLLPPVQYMTRGDTFVLGCTLLVFSAFGQAVLTGRLASGGREQLARALDRWSRWIYLAGFGAIYALTIL